MKKQNNQPVSNFWFGFALGTLTIAAGAYFFGTKKGRKELKRLFDFTENLEENLILLGEELGEEFLEKKDEFVAELKNVPHSSLHSLLDKMRVFSPSSQPKHTKKLFIKDSNTT